MIEAVINNTVVILLNDFSSYMHTYVIHTPMHSVIPVQFFGAFKQLLCKSAKFYLLKKKKNR